MSTTEITLPFADGKYRFAFTLPLATELEKHTERSMLDLAWHLQTSVAIDDGGNMIYAGGSSAEVKAIRSTIRLALQGGGVGTVDGEEIEVGPQTARDLVDTYVFPERPLAESAALACHILAVQVYGNDHPMFRKSAEDPIREAAANV